MARPSLPLAGLACAIALALFAPVAVAQPGPFRPPDDDSEQEQFFEPERDFGPERDFEPPPQMDPVPEPENDCAAAPGFQPQAGADPRGVAPRSPNPLRGLAFFLDPNEPAFLDAARSAVAGEAARARLMWAIASQPRFRWFGRWTRPNMEQKVRNFIDCAAQLQPGTVPLMTVMRHQGAACNSRYTGGGEAEDALTRDWYDAFARTVGDARVVIAFEPDSLGTIDCLARSRRRARLNLLRYGVGVLSKLPNATIYLEAGASDWEPARRTARQLRYIGVRKVRGFMLNVTHYDWTARNVRRGLRLSRLTGGKHFIVSTAYNGRGPVRYRRRISRTLWRTVNVWCHPLKRGLGPAPTTRTARPDKVDAYMWVGRPGYSGGSCNGGPLPVGAWWPERAVMFARHATGWLRPPRGSVNGHFRRYSLAELGAK